ncbi:MAG: hypothetical protein RSC41_05230 [Oscillospiraceae bacterium]
MGVFDKLKEPVILKESSKAQEHLELLQQLLETAPANIKKDIEQDIKIINAGIFGKNAISIIHSVFQTLFGEREQ